MARLASSEYAAALSVATRLRELGHAAYFAGGCVRDLLLGTAPHDFDVATSATPEQVMAAFPRTESVGAHFGVVLVIERVRSSSNAEDAGERIATEVATFRHDGAYTDGRRPDAVRFSTDPREDVLRRDFTINGLLLDVLAYEEGDRLEVCVLDFVGGRADLAAGVVRAIGEPDRRFAEDKLRMLRAVRFAARLGFAIEPRTLRAIQQTAAEIVAVSAERFRDELTRILTEGHARRGFELLDETGLLAQVLPEVTRLKGVEQPPQYHPEGDVWVHTLMLLEHLPAAASPTLAWGMLLHDVGKPATYTPPDPARPGDRIRFNGHVEVGMAIARVILNRLRFSNDDTAQILALIQHHMQFGDVMKMKQSTLKRFLRLPRFDEHLALHFADVMSSNRNTALYDFARTQLAQLGEEAVRPPLLVTGSDLITAGYRPGPAFKAILLAAEDAQLEGHVTTREEALQWVRERHPQPESIQPRHATASVGVTQAAQPVDVIVLGAGMAGLSAARALGQRGLRVLVLEARDRVGGRVLTVQGAGGVAVELGAEFIHGRAPELWALIDEAGVRTTERVGTMLRETSPGALEADEDDDSGDAMFAPLEQLVDYTGADMPFAAWLAASDTPEWVRPAVTGYVEGFNAADAAVIGVHSLGAQQKAEDASEGDRSWHVLAGYSQLAEYLAAQVQQLHGELRLQCEATALRWTPGSVSVETSQGVFAAPRCIVTLPLGVLQRVNRGGLDLQPEPSAIAQAQRLAMGHATRFTLVFRERFWLSSPACTAEALERMNFLFMRDRMPPVWWTSGGEPEALPTLTGWVGGPRAAALEDRSSADLAHEACAHLAEIFAVPEPQVRSALLAAYTHNWAGDPFALGAYSYVPAGAMDAPAAMAQPEADTLFFAGEHTDTSGHWGTVHAAIRTGLRAAAQVLGEFD